MDYTNRNLTGNSLPFSSLCCLFPEKILANWNVIKKTILILLLVGPFKLLITFIMHDIFILSFGWFLFVSIENVGTRRDNLQVFINFFKLLFSGTSKELLFGTVPHSRQEIGNKLEFSKGFDVWDLPNKF